MKLDRSLVVIADVAASSAAAASLAENKTGKDELLTLYLLSVAADRCGFPMSAKQADMIDREAKALVDKLKLGARENTRSPPRQTSHPSGRDPRLVTAMAVSPSVSGRRCKD